LRFPSRGTFDAAGAASAVVALENTFYWSSLQVLHLEINYYCGMFRGSFQDFDIYFLLNFSQREMPFHFPGVLRLFNNVKTLATFLRNVLSFYSNRESLTFNKLNFKLLTRYFHTLLNNAVPYALTFYFLFSFPFPNGLLFILGCSQFFPLKFESHML
jgi:hypothetical protein